MLKIWGWIACYWVLELYALIHHYTAITCLTLVGRLITLRWLRISIYWLPLWEPCEQSYDKQAINFLRPSMTRCQLYQRESERVLRCCVGLQLSVYILCSCLSTAEVHKFILIKLGSRHSSDETIPMSTFNRDSSRNRGDIFWIYLTSQSKSLGRS